MFLSPAMNACFYGHVDPQSTESPTSQRDEGNAVQAQRPLSPPACSNQPSSDCFDEKPETQQLLMRFHPIEITSPNPSCHGDRQLHAFCDDLNLDLSPASPSSEAGAFFLLEDEPFLTSSSSSHMNHNFDWKLDEPLPLSSLFPSDREISTNTDVRTVTESDFEPIPVPLSPVASAPPSERMQGFEHRDEERDSTSSPAYTPGKFDILCGRHKMAFNHIGNKRFRATVNVFLDRYMQLESRTKRSNLIAEIVDSILSANGRFLRYSSGAWEELGTKEARNKVGHALRDMAKAAEAPGSRRQKSDNEGVSERTSL